MFWLFYIVLYSIIVYYVYLFTKHYNNILTFVLWDVYLLHIEIVLYPNGNKFWDKLKDIISYILN